jgi:hypothetical protein
LYSGEILPIKRKNGEGTIDNSGYGKFVIRGRVISAHRLAMRNILGENSSLKK